MTKRYDLVVVGSGVAATSAAMRIREAGWSVAPGACGRTEPEVINLFALAIRKNLTAEDLKSTMFAYPTGAPDISYMV